MKNLLKASICICFLYGGSVYGQPGLGLIPSDIMPEEAVQMESFLQSDFPEYFNWGEYLSEVRDQGECGACVAFSVLGTVEARLRIVEDDPTLQIDLSEQDIVSCGPKGSDYGGCLGNKFERVCSYLHQYGVVEEDCFPYCAMEIDCLNRCDEQSVAGIGVWGILNYSYIWYVRYYGSDGNIYQGQFYIPSVSTIKEALSVGPVPVGLVILTDFYDYYGGVYEPQVFDYEGLHAVMIIGWDDDLSSWICRNSWGTDWGENGDFTIPWVAESFDIRDYDFTAACGYDYCVCNATLMGFNAIEVVPEFIDEITTTTTVETTTSTIALTTTTTTIVATTSSTTSSSLTSSSTTTTIINEVYFIKGIVVGKEGTFVKGLEGIKVDLVADKVYKMRITNELGEFEFNDLEFGTYIIDADDDREFMPKNYVLILEESIENLRFVQEDENCIIIYMFGENSDVTNSLRFIRDELMKYKWGSELVELYYNLCKESMNILGIGVQP